MINALFRTNFESNLTAFIVFLALNALMLFILVMSGFSSWAEAGDVPWAPITLWSLLFSLVAAGLSLLKHNRERWSRLYAQLPVTALQVRLAYWCHAALYISISMLLLVLLMLKAGTLPLLDLLLFALLYVGHAGALMAGLSIIAGNSLRLVPEEIRRRTIAYFFLSALITFLVLFALGYVVGWYVYVLEGGPVRWGRLVALMVVLCAALIALDIRLFQRRDSYLGQA